MCAVLCISGNNSRSPAFLSFVWFPSLPLKEAVAHGFDREYELFGTPESYFQQLPALLQQKRKRLALCLESVGLKPIMPEGGYFIMADISSVSE